MQPEAVETFEIEGVMVSIYPDWDTENPRESFDHAGTLYLDTRDYALSDKGASCPPLARTAYREDSWRYGCRYLGFIERAEVLPVRLDDYGSSGARIYTYALEDAENANGAIWMPREKIIAEYGDDSAASRKRARALLESEIQEMDQYLTGDVYGYVVETVEGDTLDSCGGLYGLDWAMSEAREAGAYCGREEREAAAWAAREGIPTI